MSGLVAGQSRSVGSQSEISRYRGIAFDKET